MDATPHVAKWLSEIDYNFSKFRNEGEKRLKNLRRFIPVFGEAAARPGLGEDTPDSIGYLLDPLDPETMRKRIMLVSEASSQSARVWLHKPGVRLLESEEADSLDEVTRAACVPIKCSAEVAVTLKPHERDEGHVRMVFDNGAALNVKRDGRLVTMEFVSKTKTRTTLSGEVPEDHESTLIDLFSEMDDSVEQRARSLNAEKKPSVPPKLVFEKEDVKMWILPEWFSEILVSDYWQDLWRAHVVINAACDSSVSRPLVVEACYLSKLPHMHLLTAVVHASSANCICNAYGHANPREKQKVEMTMRFCGAALKNGRCSTHALEGAYGVGSHPGVCVCGFSAYIQCKHKNSPDGACERIHMRKHPDLDSEVKAAMACAVRLANTQGNETRERAALEMQVQSMGLKMTRVADEQVLRANDAKARVMLHQRMARNVSKSADPCLRSIAKKSRLPSWAKNVEKTHGHLFSTR